MGHGLQRWIRILRDSIQSFIVDFPNKVENAMALQQSMIILRFAYCSQSSIFGGFSTVSCRYFSLSNVDGTMPSRTAATCNKNQLPIISELEMFSHKPIMFVLPLASAIDSLKYRRLFLLCGRTEEKTLEIRIT